MGDQIYHSLQKEIVAFKQTLVITLDNVRKGNHLHYEELNKQIL